MIAIAWSMLTALAGPPLLERLEVTPEGYRASYDVTLYIRRDGNLFLEDNLVMDIDLAREIERAAGARGPSARVVIAADAQADYARVVEVLDLVQEGGVGRVALEIGTAVPANDPLFPDIDGAVDLDQQTHAEDFANYKPKRWKYPQNPYGSTDFTAYTREWGEARIGLTSASYGVAPRVHLGTSPAANMIGVLNAQAKGNFLRLGPFDMALTGTACVVPITNILRSIDPDGVYNIGGYEVRDNEIFVNRMTYLSFQLQNSLQLYKGWSIHGGIGYSRASARGALDFYNLPVVALPGLDQLGGQVAVVPSAVGELVDLRFASDYRFNRRDSVVFQVAQSVWGSARGAFSPDVEQLPRDLQGVNNLDFVVRYDGRIPWYQTLRTSLAWQFSWQRVDLRLGWGISAVPWTWLIQAVDLSYRFGGTTRRREATIKRNYRQDRRELQVIDDLRLQLEDAVGPVEGMPPIDPDGDLPPGDLPPIDPDGDLPPPPPPIDPDEEGDAPR